MNILGVDPGIERTGVCIVSKTDCLKLVYHALIKTDSSLEHCDRLKIIYDSLNLIISNYKIDQSSVEKLFFAKNVKTAMSVSEARGVILLCLRNNSIPIFEYTPLQVKQALIGYGRATKSQIQDIVKRLLGMNDKIKPDDVADSVAIAITHLNSIKYFNKIQDAKREK